ncbi:hypothetical protein ACD631_17900 [Alteromonas macleodii]|uniref:hypothetical protein n=1 Tax=Alteromonas macleodii TaxID=28108 RepID=UPI0020767666|nr:hypothetical protein [Alteromonas macleodii]USI28215.1 hypothetical protein NFG60_00585 [Alteromonas macleodii]
MKNLIWQFHKDAKRKRDGDNSLLWAGASTELLIKYAMKHEIDYKYSATPVFWGTLPGVGPGHERFQLFEEEYDCYDYILYVDTDILFSKDAPNLFEEYRDCDIASFNWPNPQDMKLFENDGWLSKEPMTLDYYKTRYVAGGMYLMSRKFRQTLRDKVKEAPMGANGLPMSYQEFSAKWPCGDQSILSYLLCFYNLKYKHFAHQLTRGPQAYNYCGAKSTEALKEYFEKYSEYLQSWHEG